MPILPAPSYTSIQFSTINAKQEETLEIFSFLQYCPLLLAVNLTEKLAATQPILK